MGEANACRPHSASPHSDARALRPLSDLSDMPEVLIDTLHSRLRTRARHTKLEERERGLHDMAELLTRHNGAIRASEAGRERKVTSLPPLSENSKYGRSYL